MNTLPSQLVHLRSGRVGTFILILCPHLIVAAPERHGSAGRAVPLFDDPFVAHVGVGDLLDEILFLRAGSGRRAGQAAEGLHRHRRGVIPGSGAIRGGVFPPSGQGRARLPALFRRREPAVPASAHRRSARPAVWRMPQSARHPGISRAAATNRAASC